MCGFVFFCTFHTRGREGAVSVCLVTADRAHLPPVPHPQLIPGLPIASGSMTSGSDKDQRSQSALILIHDNNRYRNPSACGNGVSEGVGVVGEPSGITDTTNVVVITQ